jgi:hypothetical protein
MSKIVKTKKGTDLPLVNLKGKSYMLVAHRLVWFNEEVDNFEISTEFLLLTEDQTVAKSTIKIKDKDGNIIKQVSATKRETKKDFSDHTEKAETGSIGRCLALCNYGTAFALADLDEGERIVDSPLADTQASKPPQQEAQPKPSGFSKPSKSPPATPAKETQTNDDGWQ